MVYRVVKDALQNGHNKISNLSTDEVKKLWIENKDKIQSNVNIISDLMNYRITNQDKGIQGEGWPKRLF